MPTKKHSKIGNVDYDPQNDMELKPKKDGDVDVRYKNGKMTYDEYIDEMESRTTRHSEGKSLTSSSMGYFSGFGEGTLNRAIKNKLKKALKMKATKQLKECNIKES